MKNILKTVLVVTILGLMGCSSSSDDKPAPVSPKLLNDNALIVPEFENRMIKAYFNSGATIVDKVAYSLPFDLYGITSKPNCVAMNGNDLFIAVVGSPSKIIKLPNYGNNGTGPSITNASSITTTSSDIVGIAFDAQGNLYAAEGIYLDNKIVRYNAPAYLTTSKIILSNGGATSYFSNLVFDSAGNLWASDYLNNRVISIKQLDLNTTNAQMRSLFTNSTVFSNNGIANNENTNAALKAKILKKAFSKPEGIAFDSNGWLWVANNNDSGTNDAPTLVTVSPDYLSSVLLTGNKTITEAQYGTGYKIWNLPSLGSTPGRLGGMQIDKSNNRIFVSEQVSGFGMVFDISSLNTISNNFTDYKLPITTTNPGNGGLFLANGNQIKLN